MKVSKLISSLALVTMLSSSAFAAEGDAANAGSNDSTGKGNDATNAGVGSVTTAEVVAGLVLVGIVAAVASGNGSSGTTGTTGTQ